jgi:hypothetical protein
MVASTAWSRIMTGDLDAFAVGDRVRVERDESRYPARGTWGRYRGKVGTVVSLNRRDDEIGVILGAPRAVRPDRGRPTSAASDESTIWFRPYELRHSAVTPEAAQPRVTARFDCDHEHQPDEVLCAVCGALFTDEPAGNGEVIRLVACRCGRTLTTPDRPRLECCDE